MSLEIKKILVVDDMSTIRGLIIKILKELDYSHVEEAADGKIAWGMMERAASNESPYDLVFADINMPNMNGIELLRTARASDAYKETPIIMITTENEKEIIIEAIKEKASNYVLKPFDKDVIQKKIEEVL